MMSKEFECRPRGMAGQLIGCRVSRRRWRDRVRVRA